jgi:cation transport ATPase
MSKIIFILSFLVTITIFQPAAIIGYAHAQEDVNMSAFSMEEEDDEELKRKKKKNKEKKEDKAELNQNFFIGLGASLITTLIIIGLIYYPNYHKREILFTFFTFNLIIFLLTYVMNQVKLSMGAAFGLFAVFSMLRYRTEGISTKDMTYIFIVIAIGLISAINLEPLMLGVICVSIIILTYLLDGNIIFKRQFSKIVLYDNILLITPESENVLIEDLKSRTGLNIYKVTINKIDFLRDVASIEIFYYA